MSQTKGTPTAVDLFCGAGGLSAGLIDSGFEVRAAYELDPHAVATYGNNIGNHCHQVNISDLSEDEVLRQIQLSPGDLTLLAGGPPCQGFSVQRRAGSKDERNSLPMEFARLAKALCPAFILFENVPGIRNRHGEKVLNAFVEEMQQAGSQYTNIYHAAMA